MPQVHLHPSDKNLYVGPEKEKGWEGSRDDSRVPSTPSPECPARPPRWPTPQATPVNGLCLLTPEPLEALGLRCGPRLPHAGQRGETVIATDFQIL